MHKTRDRISTTRVLQLFKNISAAKIVINILTNHTDYGLVITVTLDLGTSTVYRVFSESHKLRKVI